jgi:hypothetical protein
MLTLVRLWLGQFLIELCGEISTLTDMSLWGSLVRCWLASLVIVPTSWLKRAESTFRLLKKACRSEAGGSVKHLLPEAALISQKRREPFETPGISPEKRRIQTELSFKALDESLIPDADGAHLPKAIFSQPPIFWLNCIDLQTSIGPNRADYCSSIYSSEPRHHL